MFSRPKILFLVSLLFVALLNPKFNPYLLFKFLIFYHSSSNNTFLAYSSHISFHVHYVAPGPVSDVTVPNELVTSSTLTLTWMEISLTNSVLSHYTVFYLPVSGPYGPIMASIRRKRQSAQAGELTMNFTGTIGTLTNLYGAVTYRIQVAVVVMLNGQVVTGDQSTANEVTTVEGGKQTVLVHTCYINNVLTL